MEKGLELDDVLLIPKFTDMKSRDDPDISVKELQLSIPIIASPVKFIGPRIIGELSDLGGIGILHRFHDRFEDLDNDLKELKGTNFGVSVGIDCTEEKLEYLLSFDPIIVCLDVANGYLDIVHQKCLWLWSILDCTVSIMSGNVVTKDGFSVLSNSGCDLIRIGIGNGGLCSTRNVTGVGVPQFTAIRCCNESLAGSLLVADGGIKSSGDAVKCLAAGANLIMMASPFAKCYEAEHDGKVWGMSSKYNNFNSKSNEGLIKEVQKEYSLKDFITEFVYGIKSGMTYCNAHNLKELKEKAEFIQVGSGSIKNL